MYKNCVTEKSAIHQRQFEKAFLDILADTSYDDITVTEICQRAGLSRKIYYTLFERKADVFYAMLDHIIMDFQTYRPDASVGAGGLHRFFGFWQEQKCLLDALEREGSSALLAERVVRHALSEDSVAKYCFGTDASKYGRESLQFYISGLFSLVLDWHKHGYDKSIDEMSEMLLYLLQTPPVKNPLGYNPYA